MSFAFELECGRMIGACIKDPIKAAEIPQFGLRLSLKMQAIGGPALLLIDILEASLLTTELATAYSELMRRDNLWAQRVALWVPGNTILANQMERVVAEVGGDKRRVCRSGEEVIQWLGEFADPRESDALRRYVIDGNLRLKTAAKRKVGKT